MDLHLEKQFPDALMTVDYKNSTTYLEVEYLSIQNIYRQDTAGYCTGEMECRTGTSNVSVPVFVCWKCLDLDMKVSLLLVAIITPSLLKVSRYILFSKAQYFLFAPGTGICYPTMFCMTENHPRPCISNGLVNQMFCIDNICHNHSFCD